MRSVLFPLMLVAAVACVPKVKYDEALADNESLRGDLDSRVAQVASLEAELSRLKMELQATETALEQTNRKLADKIVEAGALQEDIEAMRTALAEAELRKARTEAVLREFREFVSRFQSLIDAGTLVVKVIDGRMVVELATDILFPPGSATLSREGRDALQEVAQVLGSIPDREYQVSGHTDSVPISTARFPSNWHLGAERAIAVTQLLTQSGLSPERVSAASFAEFQPVDINRTPEGRENNRRIEIIVVPDLSQLPGYDELEALTEGDLPPASD